MLSKATTTIRSAVHYAFPQTSYRLIHSRHNHDEVELELLPLLVNQSRQAIDVGANVGRYAKPLASLARHVHAFEPHPRLAHILRASLPPNVTVRQVAVSDAPGRVLLYVPVFNGREDEGLGSIDDPAHDSGCLRMEVEATTLDTMASLDVGFVKIDVEGHEANVLAGARKLIADQRPILLVEAEERHNPGGVEENVAFFGARAYDGLFVFNRQILNVRSFNPSMQDISVFSRITAAAPRRSIPYVNNFIFIPTELRTPELMGQLESMLRRSK